MFCRVQFIAFGNIRIGTTKILDGVKIVVEKMKPKSSTKVFMVFVRNLNEELTLF